MKELLIQQVIYFKNNLDTVFANHRAGKKLNEAQVNFVKDSCTGLVMTATGLLLYVDTQAELNECVQTRDLYYNASLALVSAYASSQCNYQTHSEPTPRRAVSNRGTILNMANYAARVMQIKEQLDEQTHSEPCRDRMQCG